MNTFKNVFELNESAKFLLESHFNDISVEGEISRLIKHNSGHWYFSLKDEKASISATMFKNANSHLNFIPKDGDKVTCVGKISIYAPSGQYQINISKMLQSGDGDMHTAFLALKEKLEKLGLCDKSKKKPLPAFASKIGIITSLSSAAFADMKERIKKSEYFLAKFICFDSLVQGVNAPQSIINALKLADNANLDVIILARGGGSKEDLWCFNDENLAFSIAQAKTPIISAVGHEIDYSISDFVADHRSITPTAAIDDLLPTKIALEQFIDMQINNILAKEDKIIKQAKMKFNICDIKFNQNVILAKIQKLLFKLNTTQNTMNTILNTKFQKLEHQLEKLYITLQAKYELTLNKRDTINIYKNNKKISLDALKKGDKITLKSAFTSKQAEILD